MDPWQWAVLSRDMSVILLSLYQLHSNPYKHSICNIIAIQFPASNPPNRIQSSRSPTSLSISCGIIAFIFWSVDLYPIMMQLLFYRSISSMWISSLFFINPVSTKSPGTFKLGQSPHKFHKKDICLNCVFLSCPCAQSLWQKLKNTVLAFTSGAVLFTRHAVCGHPFWG